MVSNPESTETLLPGLSDPESGSDSDVPPGVAPEDYESLIDEEQGGAAGGAGRANRASLFCCCSIWLLQLARSALLSPLASWAGGLRKTLRSWAHPAACTKRRILAWAAVLCCVYLSFSVAVYCLALPLVPPLEPTERFLDAVITQRPYGRAPALSPLLPDEDGIVASPSICEVPGADGLLVATNDLVRRPVVEVHHSYDGGLTWATVSTVSPAFWATVFWHMGALHLLGTTGQYSDLVVYRSEDRGVTWSRPEDASTGLITQGEAWHRAATPVVRANGRVWTAVETWGGSWPQSFRSVVLSAPENSDLLDGRSWQMSEPVGYMRTWRQPWFWNGFLEGNFVVAPEGRLMVLLREHTYKGGSASVVELSPDGSTGVAKGSIAFPGGAKKFTVKFDPVSKRYWTLTSYLQSQPHVARGTLHLPFSSTWYQAKDVRQYQLLMSSEDLLSWTPHKAVVETSRAESASYSDFVFSGDDLLVVMRCAIVDAEGRRPPNTNASNSIGFKRIRGFRGLANETGVVIVDNALASDLSNIRLKSVSNGSSPLGSLALRPALYSSR